MAKGIPRALPRARGFFNVNLPVPGISRRRVFKGYSNSTDRLPARFVIFSLPPFRIRTSLNIPALENDRSTVSFDVYEHARSKPLWRLAVVFFLIGVLSERRRRDNGEARASVSGDFDGRVRSILQSFWNLSRGPTFARERNAQPEETSPSFGFKTSKYPSTTLGA